MCQRRSIPHGDRPGRSDGKNDESLTILFRCSEDAMTTLPDHEWIPLLTSTDVTLRDSASNELRTLLTRQMQSHFLRRGLTQSCVEDVVQESLFRIFNRLSTFRGESRFTTWATAVAVRTGLELIRRQYWKTQTLGDLIKESEADLAGPWESSEPEPNSGAEKREILELLSDAIRNALTEKQRTALLAEMKGMPMSEIASQLGSTRGAIYKLTHDARKKLKSELELRGIDATAVLSAFQTRS